MESIASRDEEWRPIPGFEGTYDVSNRGRMRRAFTGTARGARPGHVLSPTVNGGKGGHLWIALYVQGKRSKVYVHRAVAAAFLPKAEGNVVRHLDDDPTNNDVDNLAWGTQADNIHDMLRAGRARGRYSGVTHCIRGHAFDKPNTRITISGARSCRTCARLLAKITYYREKNNA